MDRERIAIDDMFTDIRNLGTIFGVEDRADALIEGWQAELAEIAQQAAGDGQEIDERIVELAVFLAATDLPFPSADRFEYWLLDPDDEHPLAEIDVLKP